MKNVSDMIVSTLVRTVVQLYKTTNQMPDRIVCSPRIYTHLVVNKFVTVDKDMELYFKGMRLIQDVRLFGTEFELQDKRGNSYGETRQLPVQ